jgi:hypothetical protein
MTLGNLRVLVFAAFAFVLSATSALANPEGTYEILGTNPGDGVTYSGRVTVQRTGDTFVLVWIVAGSRQVGIGVGKDDFLAVSYRSGTEIWTRVRSD